MRQGSEQDLAIGQSLADMATGYLINAPHLAQQQELNDQLQRALESRVMIEQAKGILAATHAITIEKAFQLLRGHACSHNASLRTVAEAVVHVGLRIDAANAAPPAGGSTLKTQHHPTASSGRS